MIHSVLLSTMLVQMKQTFARNMYRFCLIFNPIMNTILLYEIYKNSGQENFATYVVLGSGLMSIWSCICFSSAGDINRERGIGTLRVIFAAPAGFAYIILGKILGNTLLSLLSFFLSLIAAITIYKVPFYISNPVYFVVAFFMMVISFIIVSSVLACLLTLSRRTTLYMNLIEIPFLLLCGMSFPIDILPNWLQSFSRILLPTWSVELLRISVSEILDTTMFIHNLLVLLFLSSIYSLFSIYLFNVIDKRVRINASLEVS